MAWREMIDRSSVLWMWTQDMLDTLESLVPLPAGDDRYSVILDWLKTGRAEGLLTEREYDKIVGNVADIL